MLKIKENWPRVFQPDQELSLDEIVREHKKRYCTRLKFKPNVHSGTLVDALTCYRSNYCASAAEQDTYLLKQNIIPERVTRLVQAACATNKWHTIHVDRGYASIKTAEALRERRDREAAGG